MVCSVPLATLLSSRAVSGRLCCVGARAAHSSPPRFWGVFQGWDCVCHLPSSWCWGSSKDFGLRNPDFQSSRACGPGFIVLVTCSCCHLIICLLCSVLPLVLQSSTGSVLCCRCFPQLHDVGHGWTWAACSRQAGNAKHHASCSLWCLLLSAADCLTWASRSDIPRPWGPLEASFLFPSCPPAEKCAGWKKLCQKVCTNNQIFIIFVITLAGYCGQNIFTVLFLKIRHASYSKRESTKYLPLLITYV